MLIALGMAGLAREVGVLNRQAVVEPSWQAVTPTTDAQVTINVNGACSLSTLLRPWVKNVNVKAPTPLWMQENCAVAVFASIDPIVDITNFVLIEFWSTYARFDLNTKLTGDIRAFRHWRRENHPA